MTARLNNNAAKELAGLVTCDLVCWGTASPPLFSQYLDWLGEKYGSHVVAFWHRAKDTSWEGTRPMALLANGRRITGRDVELWQRLWYGKLCRPSCYACGFHSTNRPGDITIGDYWGLDGAHPGLAFGNGTSCLIVNDGQGAKLVSVCGNKLQLVPSEISLCANEKQPMLLRPPVPDENKGAFWESYYESGLEMAAKAVCAIERPSALEIAKRTARHILKPLFAKKTITTERKDSEVDDGKAWKVAEVAEDGQHDKSEYPLVYAAKNTSDKIREKSSSGGMFHALASAVIGLGGVVYGCAFDEKLSAVHIRCETIEEAERCMGSKYSQSRMGDTIKNVKEDLECGKLVLFTGTPCEVAAVRKVCGNVGGGGSLILADIVCHGTPSPALFQLQIAYINSRCKSRVVVYDHRSKWNGWGHFERFTLADGRVEQGTPLADSWRNLFYSNKMLRPSCYRCPFTTIKRESDITIADFWGIERSSRQDVKDQLGVSLVLANDTKGDNLVRALNAAGFVDIWAMELSEALPGNPMLERPSVYEGDRSEPWELLYQDGYSTMMRKMDFYENKVRNLAQRGVNKAKRIIKQILRKQ